MKDTQLKFLVVMASVFVIAMVAGRVLRPSDDTLFTVLAALVSGAVSVIYRHMDGSTTSPTPPLPDGATGKTKSEIIQTVEGKG